MPQQAIVGMCVPKFKTACFLLGDSTALIVTFENLQINRRLYWLYKVAESQDRTLSCWNSLADLLWPRSCLFRSGRVTCKPVVHNREVFYSLFSVLAKLFGYPPAPPKPHPSSKGIGSCNV